MNRVNPVLAVVLFALGVIGLAVAGCQGTVPFAPPQGYGSRGGGMMSGSGGNGMMGGGMMRGYGYAPSVNATPVPPGKPIDREIEVTARSLQFFPTSVVVNSGETVRFTITNQDAVAHNFVSQDGNIAYTFLPPNATQSVVWVAPEKGTFTVLCTFHSGMQLQVLVQ